MTRTQKLGLCTWLPEDPVNLAEMNDNFSRLDANGGRSLLLAESGMRTLGGVMAAVAHQGGHAMYADRIQVDAFKDPSQIAENGGIYYRGGCAELLSEGMNTFTVLGSTGTTTGNAYLNVTNLARETKLTQQWIKIFDFYPPAFGQLTSLTFKADTTVTATVKLKIQDAESGIDVVNTALGTINAANSVSLPTNYRLDPNLRYTAYLWVESMNQVRLRFDGITFNVTSLVYQTCDVTMTPIAIPAEAAHMELLVHDTGSASSASIRFDSGAFTAMTQESEADDRIPGGMGSTLRRYRLAIPDGAQTAQLRLTLNGAACKIYDYALIAL